IFKINSKRLRDNNWSINLTFTEALKNKEVVSIDENQMIRCIDNLKGREYQAEKINDVKALIENIKRKSSNNKNKVKINEYYDQLNNLVFVKEYVCIVMDSERDFDELNKG